MDAFCSAFCAEAASAPADVVGATCACGHRACSEENARTARRCDSIAGRSHDADDRTALHSRQVGDGRADSATSRSRRTSRHPSHLEGETP